MASSPFESCSRERQSFHQRVGKERRGGGSHEGDGLEYRMDHRVLWAGRSWLAAIKVDVFGGHMLCRDVSISKNRSVYVDHTFR